MLILPRLNPSPCLLHRGMPTIFHTWGFFNRRSGEFSTGGNWGILDRR